MIRTVAETAMLHEATLLRDVILECTDASLRLQKQTSANSMRSSSKFPAISHSTIDTRRATMMAVRSILIISCLLLSPLTFGISPAGSWNQKERATWLATQRYLDTAYSLNSPEYRSPYPYDIALTSSEVESAWNYAKQPSTGPIYKNVYQGSPGSVYVLTKIPGNHPLFSSRGLDADGVSKNAFLFWKVKKNRHKLLGVEVRAVGAPTEPLYTMEQVLREHRML